jgi:hypothetical protein
MISAPFAGTRACQWASGGAGNSATASWKSRISRGHPLELTIRFQQLEVVRPRDDAGDEAEHLAALLVDPRGRGAPANPTECRWVSSA